MTLLNKTDIQNFLLKTQGWVKKDDSLEKIFTFKTYEQTVFFVNSVTKIAIEHNHHPLVSFTYKTCTVNYCTHCPKGITQKDTECITHIEQLTVK